MPAGAFIPPWIQPADETAAAAQGFQIGARIGSQQAQQQLEAAKQEFYQQQAIKEQQLAAQREARAQAEFGLQAAESARKLDAQLKYQEAIRNNMDPLKALLEFGPGMTGQASAEAAAIRSQQMQNKPAPSWQVQDLGGGMSAAVSSAGGFHQLRPPPQTATPQTGPVQGLPIIGPDGQPVSGMFAVPAASGKGVTIHTKADTTGKLTQVERDQLHELERDQDRLQSQIDKAEDPLGPVGMLSQKDPKELKPAQAAMLAAHAKKKAEAGALQKQIDAIRARAKATQAAQPAEASPKVQRAKQLRALHPDWSKKQILDAVNQEGSNAGGTP